MARVYVCDDHHGEPISLQGMNPEDWLVFSPEDEQLIKQALREQGTLEDDE